MKTGAEGRQWVEYDSPKPPPVLDRYAYWAEEPPERSMRCSWWVRQIERGWLPNNRINTMGYDEKSEWFGVWIWEYINVLYPMIEERR